MSMDNQNIRVMKSRTGFYPVLIYVMLSEYSLQASAYERPNGQKGLDMESYLVAIDRKLNGDTPREKYDWLCRAYALLENVAYPARGTEQENWTIHDVAEKAKKLIEYEP